MIDLLKGIKSEIIDNQHLIWIPKFFVWNGNDPSLTNICTVSSEKLPGFTTHPAFFRAGEEIDGFYAGAYEAFNDNGKAGSQPDQTPWTNVDYATAMNSNRGDSWHVLHFHERTAILTLMAISYKSLIIGNGTNGAVGNLDETKIAKTGATKAEWNGFHELWGNTYEITPGMKTNGNSVYIYDSNQNYADSKCSYISNSTVIKPTPYKLGVCVNGGPISADPLPSSSIFFLSATGGGFSTNTAISGNNINGYGAGSAGAEVLAMGGPPLDATAKTLNFDSPFNFIFNRTKSNISMPYVGFRIAKYKE